MRKDIVELDENGIWVRDLSLLPVNDDENNLLYDYPKYWTETKPPTETIPFYRPKWTGIKWVEDMSQADIDALNNQPKPPTLEEQLAEVKAENELLKIRDAGMQEDINFIYETLGG